MPSVAILLAAGKGTRMRSDLAKVLHPFAGEPLVVHPLRAARAAGVERSIVVVGHQRERVREAVEAACPRADGWVVDFAVQAEQRGTGHAVQCALAALGDVDGDVFILSGDVPLLRAQTLAALREACQRSDGGLALATFEPEDPTGYGRIVRRDRRVVAIREHRDASEAERRIGECNAGIYCVRADHLRRELPTLGDANAAGEIYLTDLVARRARAGTVAAVLVDPIEVAGVNTPEQLAALEAEALARRGRAAEPEPRST